MTKRAARRVLVAAVASLLAVLAGELALRLAGVSYPVFHGPDALLGMRLRAGVAGWQRDEGSAWVEINSAGWRDVERSLVKPPGVRRVAVLGDSYVEALQVEREDGFTARLEHELSDGAREVEVLDFGVSGFGTGQALLALREHALAYSPDLVLLAFFTETDVSDNLEELKGVDYVPYFRVEDERLVLDDSHVDSPGYRWRSGALADLVRLSTRWSRIAQVAVHVRSSRRTRARNDRRTALATSGGVGLHEQVYLDAPPGPWERAWAVTRALVVEMDRVATEGGARFGVVVLSNGVQVHPDPERRRAAERRLGVRDLFGPERRLEELATEHSIPLLALAPTLAREAERDGTFFHGFDDGLGGGHWNEAGHRRAAELTASWIVERGLLDAGER